MSTAALTDATVRRRITEEALDELLFVEAGAGTGKTSQLVGRVASLVLRRDVPMREIAAVTFTEAAAAELRTRIRESLERCAHDLTVDDETRARAEQALVELDVAAIGTVHSFAQRILAEHPVEAGLPPNVEVLDEVESLLEFGRRWQEHLDAMFADVQLGPVLALASLLGIRLDGTKLPSLRNIAALFADNWDRLDGVREESVLVPTFDRRAAREALAALGPVFDAVRGSGRGQVGRQVARQPGADRTTGRGARTWIGPGRAPHGRGENQEVGRPLARKGGRLGREGGEGGGHGCRRRGRGRSRRDSRRGHRRGPAGARR